MFLNLVRRFKKLSSPQRNKFSSRIKKKAPGTTPGLQTKPLNQHIPSVEKGITNP